MDLVVISDTDDDSDDDDLPCVNCTTPILVRDCLLEGLGRYLKK